MAPIAIIAPERFDKGRLSAAERAVYDAFEPLLCYLNEDLTVDTRNAEAALGGTGIEWPKTDYAFLRRLMEYGVERGYLRAAARVATGGE